MVSTIIIALFTIKIGQPNLVTSHTLSVLVRVTIVVRYEVLLTSIWMFLYARFCMSSCKLGRSGIAVGQ